MQLKIASINIERSLHLHRVESFVKAHQPDVLCLQEVCERDIPFLESLMGNKLIYAPMTRHPAEVELEPIGIAMVAWAELTDLLIHYYHGTPPKPGELIPEIQFIQVQDQNAALQDSILNAVIFASYQGFRIATTHLNVTPKGTSTPEQRASAAKLMTVAMQEAERAGAPGHPELLLTGDFNAPRGRETFSLITKSFLDGVPPHYTTSIDASLHRAKDLQLMVDGLFHTPTYKLEHVTLHTGVSDHCALTCTLSKA